MLSEALRLIRVFHDLKQGELADRLGLSKSYLSELENGKKTPTLDVIEKYSEEFSIPASSILFFAEHLGDKPNIKTISDRARGVIASKVLDFLKFVEGKTKIDAE